MLNVDAQMSKMMEWHRLTTVLPVLTRENCITYDMDVLPMYSLSKDMDTIYDEPDVVRIRASDNGMAIGKPFNPKTYSFFSHSQVFDFVTGIFDKVGLTANIASSGTFKNRSRYYVSAEMPEMKDLMNNKHPEQLFLTAIDGCVKDAELNVGLSIVKPVCANTVNMVIQEVLLAGIKAGHTDMSDVKRAQQFCRIRHSKKFFDNLEHAKDLIEMVFMSYNVYGEQIKALGKIPVRKEEVEAIVTAFLFPLATSISMLEDCELISKKSLNLIGDITNLFVNGAGNDGLTTLDMYNGFTEKFSKRPELLDTDVNRVQRFVSSSQDGAYNRKKADFFNLLNDQESLEKACEDGFTILKAQPFLQELKTKNRNSGNDEGRDFEKEVENAELQDVQ